MHNGVGSRSLGAGESHRFFERHALMYHEVCYYHGSRPGLSHGAVNEDRQPLVWVVKALWGFELKHREETGDGVGVQSACANVCKYRMPANLGNTHRWFLNASSFGSQHRQPSSKARLILPHVAPRPPSAPCAHTSLTQSAPSSRNPAVVPFCPSCCSLR